MPSRVNDEFAVGPRADVNRFFARRPLVFLMAYVGYAACYLVRNNLIVVSEIMTAELDWTAIQIGAVLSAFTISYGVGKLVMGIVVDHLRLRFAFAWALGVSAVLCLMMAWQRDPLVFTILLAVIGLVQGACAPAALATLGAWYAPLERASRVAVWNTSQNVGAGLLSVIVSGGLALVGPREWSVGFWLPALVALACALLVGRYGGDRPWRERMPTLRTVFGPDAQPQLNIPPDVSYARLVRVHVLGNRTLLTLAALNTILYFIRFGILAWIPISGAEQRNLTYTDASMVVTAFEWGAIPGALLFAWVCHRRPRAATRAAAVAIGLLAVLIVLYAVADDPEVTIAIAVPLGALVYGPQVIVNVLTLNFVSPRAVGVAIGWVGLGGYLVGAAVANVSLPHIAAASSWMLSALTLPIACLVCIVLCLHLRTVERRLYLS